MVYLFVNLFFESPAFFDLVLDNFEISQSTAISTYKSEVINTLLVAKTVVLPDSSVFRVFRHESVVFFIESGHI